LPIQTSGPNACICTEHDRSRRGYLFFTQTGSPTWPPPTEGGRKRALERPHKATMRLESHVVLSSGPERHRLRQTHTWSYGVEPAPWIYGPFLHLLLERALGTTMSTGHGSVTLPGLTVSTAKIQLRQRSGYAVQHLMAAARFSRQCGEVEAANQGNTLGPFVDEQRSCVSATIMLSVASLESNINEHLADAEVSLAELPGGAREQFCQLISRLPILEKYDRVLAVKCLEPFDKGATPCQDVDILIALRNELVHFHPEWHDQQDRHKKLGKRLMYRFPLSPFYSQGSEVMFPDRFISHGCTRWAVDSALKFMKLFASKVGRPDRFKSHMSELRG